jgi:hypothetical protein
MRICASKSNDWFECSMKDALYILRRLEIPESGLYVETKKYFLDFHIAGTKTLCVEIDGINNFWAYSDIDLTKAEAILKIAFKDEDFNEFVPMINEIWGAYSGLE